jgi:hypothetical protein
MLQTHLLEAAAVLKPVRSNPKNSKIHQTCYCYTVSFNYAFIPSIRFVVLSCGVYVDEIHDGMLALLSQVGCFSQDLHKPHSQLSV